VLKPIGEWNELLNDSVFKIKGVLDSVYVEGIKPLRILSGYCVFVSYAPDTLKNKIQESKTILVIELELFAETKVIKVVIDVKKVVGSIGLNLKFSIKLIVDIKGREIENSIKSWFEYAVQVANGVGDTTTQIFLILMIDHRVLQMAFLLRPSRSFLFRINRIQNSFIRYPNHYSARFFSKDLTTSSNIEVVNLQTALPNINQEKLKDLISRIRAILGYETYSVSLHLVDDKFMQKVNYDTRNVDAPTDILSFQMQHASQPGKLDPPIFNIPDLYCLGEMLVDVPYVIRRCNEDAQDDTVEYEESRGVSHAMSKIYDPEIRIQMLLIHGMLHLVGYDHIEDEDYYCMVAEEERLLQLLNLC
jgi:probable rRNA maturation factor